MNVELSRGEIQVLVQSLDYSLQRVGASQGTPVEVKKENLKRIEDVKTKLLNAVRGQE